MNPPSATFAAISPRDRSVIAFALAAAIWTANVTTAGRLACGLRAGTVWVNTVDASALATPLRAMKDSGHGRVRSLHALDAFTQLKTTWIAIS